MGKNLNERYYELDGKFYIQCTDCHQFLIEDMFDIARSNKTGRIYTCKPCNSEKLKKPILIDDIDNKELSDLTRGVLRRLGYNIEENIHQQFLSRLEGRYGVKLK